MLITSAPIALPISTANPPTEAIEKENAQKFPIPEPKSAAENPNTRNATDNNQQAQNTDGLKNFSNPKENISEDGSSKDNSSENNEGSDAQQKQAELERKELERAEQQQETVKREEIERLRRNDSEIRAHERAHTSVGGQLTGAPQYQYEVGPDGKKYAVSGEVAIDISRVNNNPQATVDKLQQVRQAALAPANPSSQDLKVAARATQLINQALSELAIQRSQQLEQGSNTQNSSNNNLGTNTEPSNKASFINPVTAKRSSVALNQKISESGALNEEKNISRLSIAV